MSPARIRETLLDGLVAASLLGGVAIVFAIDRKAGPETEPPVVSIDLAAEISESGAPEPPLREPPALELPASLIAVIDPERRIRVECQDDMRFGIVTTSGNPDDRSDDDKRLTFAASGGTNNTRLWVDGETPSVGSPDGSMVSPVAETDASKLEATWSYRDVHVTQTIRYVPGQTSNRIDTIEVDYLLENHGTGSRDVGLRVMIDSLIGGNDGVPFIVPGREGLVSTPQVFRGGAVPDFVRALEAPDLVKPGVIADLGLRPSEGERPTEVVLTHWPGAEADWDYNRTRSLGWDSAIGLYYAPQPLAAAARRHIRFTYGLGAISSTLTRNARLSLTAGGPFKAGGRFWIVALVPEPKAGQTVELELPQGLKLASDHADTKPVSLGESYSQLSWLIDVDAAMVGPVSLRATLRPEEVIETQSVVIEPRDARMLLHVKQPVRSGRRFWVSALVRDAQPGLSVELTLPQGLKLVDGEHAKKPVPVGEGYTQVNWQVLSASGIKGTLPLGLSLLPTGLTQEIMIAVEQGTLID
jgi:hypothetical protein